MTEFFSHINTIALAGIIISSAIASILEVGCEEPLSDIHRVAFSYAAVILRVVALGGVLACIWSFSGFAFVGAFVLVGLVVDLCARLLVMSAVAGIAIVVHIKA